MHSGPVTAGVLRGERARFQLFGDTVNTAARYAFQMTPCALLLSDKWICGMWYGQSQLSCCFIAMLPLYD